MMTSSACRTQLTQLTSNLRYATRPQQP